jgi:hypothetical protein
MVRAAALRPMNVLVLVVGIVFFVVTFAWWALPLTLATYAALIALGAGDPLLQRRVLGRDEPEIPQSRDLSPERRARWLPRGETLDDTMPRLHAAAERLVDVALQREKAAETVRDLRGKPGASPESENLRRLEEHVDEADEEITATSRELVDVRAKVVRVSIDTSNAQRADDLNASLDELNARLEALGDVAPNG